MFYKIIQNKTLELEETVYHEHVHQPHNCTYNPRNQDNKIAQPSIQRPPIENTKGW
jgi:hypothetical protein